MTAKASKRVTTNRNPNLMVRALTVAAALALVCGAASAQPVIVNPGGGSYATLKHAFDAINAGAHTGAITVDIAGDTTETVPAVLNASGSGAASYSSILIQPSGGGARVVSGAIAAGSPLIDLNGADNVTIDGLNTGGNALTISNTTVSATSGTSTIRFIDGATGNTITNATIQGSGSMSVATNGAVIFFSTDAVTANGNDNNTISNSNIGPAGANLPTKGIYGIGSTPTTAIGNSGIVITNNNIFDYFGAAVTSAGIYTGGGCNTWTITDNRFYQTGTRTWTTGAQHSPIWVIPSTATSGAQGFTITGNTIGYATSSQTGTYTLTGSTGKFVGIYYNGITGGALTSISSNTIAAVSVSGVTSSGTSTGSPFAGIIVANGLAETNGNTFGSQSGTGSLTFSTTTTTGTDVYGIFNFSVNNWNANNNTFGSITASNAGASGAFIVYLMRENTGSAYTFTASGNTIGGTTASSIQNTSTSTTAQLIGIHATSTITTFTGNTIRNLTASGGTGTTTGASVIGMSVNGTSAAGRTVSQNTIHTLANAHATAATIVTGIQYTGAATGTNVVARNLIYGLTSATNSASAEVNGIRVAGGTTVYRNNMIAIGAGIASALGSAATNSATTGVNGVNEFLGTNSFFHNSVYIGGAPTSGSGASYAFNGTQTVNPRSFRDNIFFNARSNSGATGKNYAVKVNGTTPNPTGLTINNNLYSANGVGAVFGFFNSLDVADLAAWKLAVGQDASSFESNPQYNDPTNATPDLHLHPTNATVAEGNGADVGVTDDFDGQTRSGLTPVDIGADAGNFVGIDLAAPAIAYTPFPLSSSTSDRTLTATLTDVTGVATGGLAPRIYYRKGAGAWFSQACSLTGGTVNSGSWDCAVVVADLGGVVAGDVIGYFLIAQDTAVPVNIGSNPGGAAASDVTAVISPPGTPNTYTVALTFSGSIPVGTAETYTSLTNAGGIFEAFNSGVATGDVTVDITSDLSAETGTFALNQVAEEGVGGYTVTIRPSGAPRVVSGSLNGALIRLNGADRVVVDGSTTGGTASGVGGNAALRELTIQNTNTGTSAAVIWVQTGSNGAQGNTIRNAVVSGQDPTTTLLAVGFGGNTVGTVGADNDGNRVENCAIQKATYGIYSAGASLANQNVGSVFTMNDLSATAANRIRRVGIAVFNENGIQITRNAVGGIDTAESADAVGIGVGAQSFTATTTTAGGVTNALVAGNRVNGVANTTTYSAAGIAVAGDTGGANTIANNMISGVISNATSGDLVAGIFVVGAPGSSTRLYHNSVAMSGDRGATATQYTSFALAVTGTDPTVELKDNLFFTSQIASGGGANAKSYAIGLASTTFVNLDADFNGYWATGANAGHFRAGSLATAAGSDYATLAAWQGAVADDASSFQADPLFVSTSDLHIPSTSPAVAAGTALAAVTTDFDGEARSATSPDVGADEIVNTDLAITKTDYAATAVPGTSTVYDIVVSNNGPDAALDTTVTDDFLALLTCTYTAFQTGGATSFTVSGAGDINDTTVDLPAGSVVTYTATCAIPAGASGTLTNSAAVAAAAGVIDTNSGNDSATDVTVLSPQADLAVTKNDGVDDAVPGQSVTYTIWVTNFGPSDAPGSTVTDTFPAALSCTYTATQTGGATGFTASGSGNINDSSVNLPDGAEVIYTAVCSITPGATGTVANTATVDTAASITDPDAGNDSDTDTDTLVAMADVSVVKTVGNPTPGVGESVTFTVTASNAGPSVATGVAVTDLLPPGLSYSSDAPSTGTYTPATGLWTIGTIANGGSETLVIIATADRAEAMVNLASKTGQGDVDPDPSDNVALVGLNSPPLSDIQVQQTVSPVFVDAGQAVTFTVTAHNAGPATAVGVEISDNLPTDLSFVSAAASQGSYSSGTGIWTVGTLAADATATLEVVATVSTTIPFTRTVTKTAPAKTLDITGDPVSGNDAASATVNDSASADLALSKRASQDPVTNGTTFTYTIVVTNNGPAAATGVTVTDDVSALGVTVNSVTPSQGTCSAPPSISCSLGGLAPGGTATITLDVTKTAGGTLTNSASASAAESDPNAANNSTDDTTVPVELMSFTVS